MLGRRDHSLTMEEVQARFNQWRKTRRGRSRIPDELWAAAGELARKHGVNRISRVLRLEFNHLKRMAEAGGQISTTRAEKAPAFLELVNPGARGLPEYTIEVDGPNSTLRIHCQGVTAAEIADLSRAVWSVAS
jgi:hypothetical protein